MTAAAGDAASGRPCVSLQLQRRARPEAEVAAVTGSRVGGAEAARRRRAGGAARWITSSAWRAPVSTPCGAASRVSGDSICTVSSSGATLVKRAGRRSCSAAPSRPLPTRLSLQVSRHLASPVASNGTARTDDAAARAMLRRRARRTPARSTDAAGTTHHRRRRRSLRLRTRRRRAAAAWIGTYTCAQGTVRTPDAHEAHQACIMQRALTRENPRGAVPALAVAAPLWQRRLAVVRGVQQPLEINKSIVIKCVRHSMCTRTQSASRSNKQMKSIPQGRSRAAPSSSTMLMHDTQWLHGIALAATAFAAGRREKARC